MTTRIIRMSTIPPWSGCCWLAKAIRHTRNRSIARANGSSACSRKARPVRRRLGRVRAENIHLHLNHIPFADHGALLDPPTSDVTARCVSFLAQIGMTADDPVMTRALAFLRREQEADGSWFGRWGTNYIYGTWSVLCALNAVGLPHDDPAITPSRGLACFSAARRRRLGRRRGNLSRCPARPLPRIVAKPDRLGRAWPDGGGAGGTSRGGSGHRVSDGDAAAGWGVDGAPYNAVGFPRVFYLRYHGYRLYFPLLALARYRNLRSANSKRVSFGF